MNVIKFPTPTKELCCECDGRATHSLRLVNFDTGDFPDRKLFCDEHFPKHYIHSPTSAGDIQ